MRLTAITVGVLLGAIVFVSGGNTAHAQTETTKEESTPKPVMVEVQPGDSLSKIGKKHETTYQRLFNANEKIKNPDLIYPGDELRVPAADEELKERPIAAIAPVVRATPAPKTQQKQRTAQPVARTTPQPTQQVTAAPAVSSGSVWDQLAQCESSGNWSINTGNGYYGGLQFLPATWRSVGGTGLPHQHSREEQIKRAQILQARSGWGQWPACTAKLGLR